MLLQDAADDDPDLGSGTFPYRAVDGDVLAKREHNFGGDDLYPSLRPRALRLPGLRSDPSRRWTANTLRNSFPPESPNRLNEPPV